MRRLSKLRLALTGRSGNRPNCGRTGIFHREFPISLADCSSYVLLSIVVVMLDTNFKFEQKLAFRCLSCVTLSLLPPARNLNHRNCSGLDWAFQELWDGHTYGLARRGYPSPKQSTHIAISVHVRSLEMSESIQDQYCTWFVSAVDISVTDGDNCAPKSSMVILQGHGKVGFDINWCGSDFKVVGFPSFCFFVTRSKTT